MVFNDWKGVRAGDHKPIHQYLHEAGYEVGHVGVHHIRVRPSIEERVPFSTWISRPEYGEFLKRRGIDRSGEDWSAFRRGIEENQEGRFVPVRYSNTRTAVWQHEAESWLDSYWCREAADFLRRQRQGPFALFLYLWAPHPPFVVPEPYASRFAPEDIDLPPNVGLPSEGEPPGRRRGIAARLAEGVSMDEWRRAWAAHLGLVSLADAGIGCVLRALDESGRSDDTVVLFTVDHGDMLGQHAMFQKMEMYEQAVRVPLVFRGPGIAQGTNDRPVSHLDIAPTLLELAGIDVPADMEGDSLSPSLLSGTPPRERAVFSEYSGNPTTGDIRRMVVRGRYKYVYDPDDVPELYDLEADPLETRNLAPDPAHEATLRDLHAECRAWAEAHDDWVGF